jgi:PKD repeat protein
LSAVALALLALGSCGGSNSGQVADGGWHTTPGFSAGLPFPVDHAVSVASTTTKTGIQDDTATSHNTAFGNALELDATASAPEWATYSFQPPNAPTKVVVSVDDAHTTQYWVGAADFTKLHWVFTGPFTTSQTVTLTSDDVSPLGNSFVAVVTPPSETVRIETVALSVDDNPPVPSFTTSAGGPAPIQIDVDASASTDADGSITLYEWDWQNDGTYDDSAATPIANHIYSVPGTYTIKLRVTDNTGVTATLTHDVVVTTATNQKPKAVVTASPNQAPPYDSTLDASGSFDPDGTIVDYAWDTDNNGTFETDTGTTPTLQFHVPAVGAYTIGLQVTDNTGGLGGMDTTVVTVLGTGWKDIAIETSGPPGDTCGDQSSLAEINGKPGIAYEYIDALMNKRYVHYAYATTATGGNASDWQIVTLPSSGAALNGGLMSLAEIDGNPAVAYNSTSLAYARSSSATGGSAADWSPIQPVNGTLGFTDSVSLCEISGHAAMAFDSSSNVLSYTYSSTVDGTNQADWSSPVQVDPTSNGGLGRFFSLAEVSGSPAIGYSSSDGHARYARANDATGASAGSWSGGGASQFDVSATSSGESWLAVVNGHPAMAFYLVEGGGDLDLGYAYSSSVDGANAGDWTTLDIDTGPIHTGQLPKLAVCNGKPAVLCIDFADNPPPYATYFSQATTADGANVMDWPTHGSSVPAVNMGNYNSFTSINGYPALSYYDDFPDSDLHYAILFQ